jgi:pimeloyl-ACP methyl ester carboxylesterase
MVVGQEDQARLESWTALNISAGIHGVGMVATGVAARAPDRITQMIYVDAFVPADGQSLLDLNEVTRPRMQELSETGDGWRVPPNPTPPDTPAADLEWLSARRVDMPIKCFETKLRLQGGPLTLPRSYIYATRITPRIRSGHSPR